MNGFFQEKGFATFGFLHNNCHFYGEYAICGTRGWFLEEEQKPHNAKVLNRELMRLETSLKAAQGRPILCFCTIRRCIRAMSVPRFWPCWRNTGRNSAATATFTARLSAAERKETGMEPPFPSSRRTIWGLSRKKFAINGKKAGFFKIFLLKYRFATAFSR